MPTLLARRQRNAAASLLLPFTLFFLIAFGLGSPILNRYDPRQTPGLADVKTYAAIESGEPVTGAEHMRFRVLVPWVARPFYHLAEGRFATWDPVMFGLLTSNSLFVAATAVVIVVIGSRQLASPTTGLVGALLYLVNFAVPNLRLAGLVDSGEGFFLLALLWSLAERRLWALSAIAVLGTMAKESFVPFSVVFTAAWWVTVRFDDKRGNAQQRSNAGGPTADLSAAAWILASWALSLGTMMTLHHWVTGRWISPLDFGLSLHQGDDNFTHFTSSLLDRNFWYIFAWLLPTAIPNLRRLPRTWLVPVAATCVMAFFLDGYFGGAPGTVGRALFSIAGPMLSLSSALWVMKLIESFSGDPKTI